MCIYIIYTLIINLYFILEHEISVECNETTENLWTFLQTNVNNMQSHTTSTSSAISIVRQYMNMPYQHLHSNVVEFWLKHKLVMCTLSEVALKYSIIPATSVPSERIFSKTGQIMSARRNRILPKNLNALIFLNKNM